MIAAKAKLLATTILFVALLFPHVGHALEGNTLLVSGEKAVEDAIRKRLKDPLAIHPIGIDKDYEGQAFITAEGTRIGFSDLLHESSLQDAEGLRQLNLEYGPDYVLLAWVIVGEPVVYKAYGVVETKFTVRLRLVDARNGQNIIDKSLDFSTGMVREGSNKDITRNRQGAIASAIARVEKNKKYLLAAVTAIEKTLGKKPRDQQIRIVFKNITNEDYFNKHDGIVSLVKGAGAVSNVRDSYDQNNEELTVRVTVASDIDTYYRSLYTAALGSDSFDNFRFARDGIHIRVEALKALPPELKRLVVSGLDPDRYRHRLDAYRDSILPQPGVSELEFQFLVGAGSADSQLAFTFVYDEDLTALEDQIWRKLEELGRTPNRKLASITDQVIHYQAGPAAVDLNTLTLVISQVDPDTFRRIGSPLDQAIQTLPIRNFDKKYDRETAVLNYRFELRDTTESFSTFFEGVIESTPELENIVLTSLSDSELVFFYDHELPTNLPVVIVVRDLNQVDYQSVGRELIAVVQLIEGVERFNPRYSATEQTLRLSFRYQGKQLFLGFLRFNLLGSDSLSHLDVSQSGGEIVLVPLPAERKRLAIAGLTAERYHHRLGVYRSAITTQEGVTDVDYEYLAGTAGQSGQLLFTFSYAGELAALEDRVWASLATTGETPNRQLTAISDRMIQYQAGGEAVLTAFFRNVAPTDYSQIRDSLNRIFKDLGVRDLKRGYADTAELLTYRFQSKQTVVQLDAFLWEQIEATPVLQNFVPGAASDNSLEYTYTVPVVTVQPVKTVRFNNIAPDNYRKIGALLKQIINQVPDMRDQEMGYDSNAALLTSRFVTSLTPVELDAFLWEQIEATPELDNIVPGPASDNSLEYTYTVPVVTVQPVKTVRFNNIAPDNYRKIGALLKQIINQVPDMRDQEMGYDRHNYRLVYTFETETTTVQLDTLIWEKIEATPELDNIVQDTTTTNDLGYFYLQEPPDPGPWDTLATICLREVSTDDYFNVSSKFAKLLRRIRHVRRGSVMIDYEISESTALFYLRYEGDDLFQLREAIQLAMLRDSLFERSLPAPPSSGEKICYVFRGVPTAESSVGPKVETPDAPLNAADNTTTATAITDGTEADVAQGDSTSAPDVSESLADLVVRLDETVVFIRLECKPEAEEAGECLESSGTGFFITTNGHILTNAHVAQPWLVIEKMAKLWVWTLDGHYFSAHAIKSDYEQDLALLRLDSPVRTFAAVEIGDSDRVRKGDQVLLIGNPGTDQGVLEHSVATGIVAGLNRDKGRIELSLPSLPGTSGSPVFNMRGQVIAVNVEGVTSAEVVTVPVSADTNSTTVDIAIPVMVETISLVIPINYARPLIQLAIP